MKLSAKTFDPLFRLIRRVVDICYPKQQVVGFENVPDGAAVIVGNHTQMNGPIVCELYFSEDCFTWCAGQMMNVREVPSYAFADFWSEKPLRSRWFYKILSYLIAPLSAVVFNNARTIPVYHDSRILTTFKTTVGKLKNGKRVVIFPEYAKEYNNIICDFHDRFIDVAKPYYRQTGKELSFVPMYIAPNLKKVILGKPVKFCAENPIEEERRRICDYLMNEITGIAEACPVHRVVPYKNIPKKLYPLSIPKER
ncbi:MAG: hypothetical protein IJ285_01660 [Clostridia bacterium]|nr:hypothetical protein [Clostridia bacterium]